MALVVENGAGLSNAESYESVAGADAYHAAQGNPVAWAAAPTTTKEDALRQATVYIDERYGSRWKGLRTYEAQALRWPRSAVEDFDGFVLPGNVLPARLKKATAEVALRVVEGTALFEDEANEGGLLAESVTVGPISISETHAGGKSSQTLFTKADVLLREYVFATSMRERA